MNPAYRKWFANKTQRGAAKRLEEQHGFDKVIGVIGILRQTNQMPYVPSVTTPDQLENKWAALEAAMLKYKAKEQNKRHVII